ncbi:MAG: hypothetical protein ACHREM_16740 [Polyangiales bacterium]
MSRRYALKRRYGHTARRGLPRSLKTVADFAEHAADLRDVAGHFLKSADQPWRSAKNKAALLKIVARKLHEAQRADHEVMQLGGTP